MPELKFLPVAGIVFLFLFSCATAAKKGPAPDWVISPERVYPDSEFISAVGYGADRAAAESAAVSSLTKIFRQTVRSETVAMQRYTDAVLLDAQSDSPLFSESREYVQQVNTSSDVASVIGVSIRNVWTASDGTVYTLAQMDRKKSAARYASLIRENESVVLALVQDAALRPDTFDAYGGLDFASDIALVNDNFLDILSVLDMNVWRLCAPDYGNAAAVKKLAKDAASRITIKIHIDNDVNGRIAAAFASCFADMGFKTASDPAVYELSGDFQVQDTVLDNPNKFVRYTVNASLSDIRTGTVLVPYSVNGREGHVTAEEARQRSVRTAEQDIKKTFGAAFRAYLDSLLSHS